MNLTSTKSCRLAAAFLAGAVALGVTGCGSGAGSSSTGPATSPPSSASASVSPATSTPPASPSVTTSAPAGTPAATTIHIQSFAYSAVDSVPAGATLTVMNMDTEAHTVTADDGSFDVIVKGGESVTFTAPAKPGTYTFHCTYHSNMQGTLTVT
ncbi:hypothetical protein BJG92_02869 [Arthrobacter sp. SO5]|uniref:cupredoxin domain-containing protein n=1 Tax=Arthrobacter sp. SO5 TaxID=1897055 RepID=UPI001E2F49AD|nr:cupredoxin domain-containing protein [Arthrobacter sp. SO5]MCB5275321.1 hypothetical protein [Arthrobacter sp. SO5]